MKYCSTRGGVRGASFEDALFSGYASDGGLMMPEIIPQVPNSTLKSWNAISFKELAFEIIQLFVSSTELDSETLKELIEAAYSSERFDDESIAPIAKQKDGLMVFELFHGSTLAFKDLALSLVGQLMKHFVKTRDRRATVLVGTSGDTGSASIHAVRDLENVRLIVLLPRGRTSKLQELQMTTVKASNVKVFRVDGTSDDLDYPIRQCFEDQEFVRNYGLCSINSINWARVMVQLVHFFYGYLQVCPEADGIVEFVVPTGACGNVTSGYLAKAMGLPVKFLCSVNENDIVHRFLSVGDLSMAKDVLPTLSPAMDIQMPYNCERLLWLSCNQDGKRVADLMMEFWKESSLKIPEDILKSLQLDIESTVTEQSRMLDTLRRCFAENNYTLCPHTATAVAHFYKQKDATNEGSKQIENKHSLLYVATASPAKFPEALSEAGIPAVVHPAVTGLDKLPTYSSDWESDQNWLIELKAAVTKLNE